LDQTSAVVEFVGAFESNDGAEGEGGKPAVVDEAKLFNGEKFGVGIPKDGNAPNGDIDGKPNGRPQGRSRKYIICNKNNNFHEKERNHTIKT
jgi:hypothetical protein